MTPVNVASSSIAAIGWEDGTLLVEFLNGQSYEYYEVPQEVYEEFLNAQSHGKFYHAYIKEIYPGSKL